MPKKKQSKKAQEQKHVSPLNHSVDDAQDDDKAISRRDNRTKKTNKTSSSGKVHKDNKHALSETKLAEEAALTAMLFGGGGGVGGASSGAWTDDDDDDQINDTSAWDEKYGNQNSEEDDSDKEEKAAESSGDLFAIDRSGEDIEEDEDDADERSDDEHQSDTDSDGDDDEFEQEVNKGSMQGAAWQDPESDSDSDDSDDDDSDSEERIMKTKKQKGVSLVDGPNRLKKLRRYRDETDPLSLSEYELRLRERFMNTTSVAANTGWADVNQIQQKQEEPKTKRKRGGYGSSSEDDESGDEDYNVATDILESNASLFQHSSSGMQLPPTILDVVRTRDGNLSDPNNSVLSAVQFHPGSDEENPLLMTAGMDKMLRFFRIDGEENPKIHGIHFPTLPITCASFLGDSGSVVMSGRRPFFYVYDAISGNIQKIQSIIGRKERSLEKFTVSPSGDVIAFVGNDGYIILVDGKSRQWIGDLKMNGSVRAITFSEDGEFIMGSGSDGDVYKWNVRSRRCVERFHNEDGTITSALAATSNFLAVGSESGVVNLYTEKYSKTSLYGGSDSGVGLNATKRNPLKSIMNLTTSADSLKFSADGQILALSTRRETNGLKLLHVPTQTVFSNWPTSKTPLKYVWSTDFSPGSKYFAVGNDHGKCLLYRLKHYWDE
ncbi:U3 small nucleolar RNA-associated protein 18 [Skeletonema marinoi]|uniref:U3 small nucleolar RNA-associated protein 18 n=1 Tax=Skeletonema marinoi TaxID=267567 RepID=A0AAD9DBG8_9STRA|nr:U3 small nucleolar RNA-associated protein 18 [Skeletonema marinoi]